MTATAYLPVSEIREGDLFIDTDGRKLTAWRDAEFVPETGWVNIVDTDYRHHDYAPNTQLLVTYDDTYANEW